MPDTCPPGPPPPDPARRQPDPPRADESVHREGHCGRPRRGKTPDPPAGPVFRRRVPGQGHRQSAAAALCAHASIVLPRSAREARILTRGLGVPERKITVVPPAVDPRTLDADRSLFTRRVPAERFILADGIGGEPERNIPLLLQALAKINHPAVLLLDPVNRSAAAYRSLAAGNPRLHLVDDVAQGSDLYVAAVAAAELVVDVSLDQAGGLAFSAAAAGAKLVVSRTAGWEEYFASDAEYVEPTSWELMHHGITTALNAPQGDALRDRIRGECSQATVLATLERAYRSLS